MSGMGTVSVRQRSARRLAVIADTHGNAAALTAVLAAIEESDVDLVVSLGDSTYGSEPDPTRALLESIRQPAIHIRGNGERALFELRRGRDANPRECWMREHHSDATHDFLEQSVESAVVTIDGLGDVLFCHGSPRSDIELITQRTSEERMRALMRDVPERILVTGHTHLQFDRHVAGIRSINPGSVGMPYSETQGAFWAILGPDVQLMRSEYDVEETVRAYQASGDPLASEMVSILRSPPAPEEVIAHAESLEFRE